MDPRIILIGLNNPLSEKPGDALAPFPSLHPSGHKLFEMLREVDQHFTLDDYFESFERYNLWPGRDLPVGSGTTALLRREGRRLLRICVKSTRCVVCFGSQVWSSVVMRTPPSWFEYQFKMGSQFWYLPNPSIRNRLYNDHERRHRTAQVLLNLVAQEQRVARELAEASHTTGEPNE